ncbi:SWIB-domain containing protein [Dishui Lake large algae virus 1]|nr:SWIB-domain containing protein [Dishui Lake large algae virus 1]
MVSKKNTTAVAAPVAPVPAPAVKEGKEVKSKAKEQKVAETTPVAPVKAAKTAEKVVTPPAPTPAAETVVDAEDVSPLDAVFAKLTAATALFKEIQSTLKVLQKSYDKMKKVCEKQEKKKANARTTPSGFAKPTKISDELCAFLNVPKGTQLSRTDVTRRINSYVKEHNLYDPSNRRIINPDANLKKILVLKPGEQLSFFTLQRAIKSHFASSVKA